MVVLIAKAGGVFCFYCIFILPNVAVHVLNCDITLTIYIILIQQSSFFKFFLIEFLGPGALKAKHIMCAITSHQLLIVSGSALEGCVCSLTEHLQGL